MEQQPIDESEPAQVLNTLTFSVDEFGSVFHGWPSRPRRYFPQDADPAPRAVRETVFCQERYDGDWPPEDAVGFMAWFQGHLTLMPGEYRNTARIELTSNSGYEDSHYVEIDISYTRPETPEEIAERQEGWRKQCAAAETEQRAEFERLKAKFG